VGLRLLNFGLMIGRLTKVWFGCRWRVSPPFRRLMQHLTIYWTVCSALYCVVTALVSWLTPLNFAFGWVLGQMFIWGAVCAMGCKLLVRWGLKREKEWWDRRSGTSKDTEG
jgi:hypothetical protein